MRQVCDVPSWRIGGHGDRHHRAPAQGVYVCLDVKCSTRDSTHANRRRCVCRVVNAPADVMIMRGEQEVVFDRLRKAAGLGTVSASDALAAFQGAADEELNLSRAAFHEVLRANFLPQHQSNLEYEQSRLLLDRVFDAFDTDSNGMVVRGFMLVALGGTGG